jgi:tRNA modification GTPase
MFSTDDTIVAIATPPGRGGIGVVRLSGPDARVVAGRVLDRLPAAPRRATLARVMAGGTSGAGGEARPALDEVLATVFAGPASYTGEDVVEISAHGSPVVLRAIVEAAMRAGARLAEAGEFTLRAFLHGKLDLVQAEAIGDLVAAVTPLQARAAFDQLEGTLTRAIGEVERDLFDLVAGLEASIDFPEEGYHFVDRAAAREKLGATVEALKRLLADGSLGRMVREGRQVAVVGAPNAGKSSVFNVLAGAMRAIVAAAPGTTRDLVSETVDLGGLRITLVDTAGMRASADEVEREGVSRARQAAEVADAVIVVLDRSRPLAEEDRKVLFETARKRRVIAVNKSDLPAGWLPEEALSDCAGGRGRLAVVSAKTGAGMDQLREGVIGALEEEDGRAERDVPAVTNLRHIALLERAAAAVARAVAALDQASGPMSEEFVVADLQEARAALEEVTGKRSSEDLLRRIFERFCVGK